MHVADNLNLAIKRRSRKIRGNTGNIKLNSYGEVEIEIGNE